MATRSAAFSLPLRSFTRNKHTVPSEAYTNASKREDPAVQSSPEDLTPSERHALESALRVDQAGEIAANYIYKGQMTVLGRDRQVGNLIQACFLK